MDSQFIVGIDLGTTNSALAYCERSAAASALAWWWDTRWELHEQLLARDAAPPVDQRAEYIEETG